MVGVSGGVDPACQCRNPFLVLTKQIVPRHHSNPGRPPDHVSRGVHTFPFHRLGNLGFCPEKAAMHYFYSHALFVLLCQRWLGHDFITWLRPIYCMASAWQLLPSTRRSIWNRIEFLKRSQLFFVSVLSLPSTSMHEEDLISLWKWVPGVWEEIIMAAESCPHLRANSTDLFIKPSFNCLQGGSASIVIETEQAKFESNNQSTTWV